MHTYDFKTTGGLFKNAVCLSKAERGRLKADQAKLFEIVFFVLAASQSRKKMSRDGPKYHLANAMR